MWIHTILANLGGPKAVTNFNIFMEFIANLSKNGVGMFSIHFPTALQGVCCIESAALFSFTDSSCLCWTFVSSSSLAWASMSDVCISNLISLTESGMKLCSPDSFTRVLSGLVFMSVLVAVSGHSTSSISLFSGVSFLFESKTFYSFLLKEQSLRSNIKSTRPKISSACSHVWPSVRPSEFALIGCWENDD